MKLFKIVLIGLLVVSCAEETKKALNTQEIVDKAIEVSGGKLYKKSTFSFDFRDKSYVLTKDTSTNKRLMIRMFSSDSSQIVDTKGPNYFIRTINEEKVEIPDSLAHKYANSINSVHYFAYLPYGLNDAAVKKKFISKTKIKGKDYYLIQVTFAEENGGDDFDDVYLYWFNKETFKPDFLAYEFHVDGGGMRFREAFNERYINGIRFVDYKNYKPGEPISIFDIGAHFEANKLEFLSEIALTNIEVEQTN